MKRILFNASHAEELRVAIVDGQRLLDLDLESAIRVQRKGNIYKGTVTRVEPSLEACFVSYGTDRHGFLPFKEIYRGYFQNYSSKTPLSKVNIKDVIKEGQELIVQVEKDERGNKGAALTTFISLAGRFLVLMPNNPKGGGISRRVVGQQRTDLKTALDSLKMPKQHALIARTAALGRSEEELKWDFEFLLQLWTAIEDASANSKAPILIYQETNLLVRAIRDHLNDKVSELIIDDKEIFERATRFVKQVMPRNLPKLKMHEENIPLFSRFQIEHQIESAFSREVSLPSGGAIVIDHTEALISIDVNSARATKGSDIEETALNTNLEAVVEIARQLRIRDLGGLLVLDLIDMGETKNQRKVEARLKSSLSEDRARVQIGRISRFGLLEMSRQRIRASIGDSNYHTCPRCEGTGHIRSIVSQSLNLLRIIEEEALKENTESLQVFLPVNTAAYILNEKRRELTQLESRLATRVVVVPNADMQSPHYEIKRLRGNDLDENPSKPSHELTLDNDKFEQFHDIMERKPKPEKPVISLDQMTPATPPPTAATNKAPSSEQIKSAVRNDQGLIKRLWKTIKGEPVDAVVKSSKLSEEKTRVKASSAPENPNSNKQQNTAQNKTQNRPYRKKRPIRRSNNNRSNPNQGGNRQVHNQQQGSLANQDKPAVAPTKETKTASNPTADNAGNETKGNSANSKSPRRPRPRKKVTSRPDNRAKQQPEHSSNATPQSSPSRAEDKGNQKTANVAKPAPVRKKRVSKKKITKKSAGNVTRAPKTDSVEVDGNVK